MLSPDISEVYPNNESQPWLSNAHAQSAKKNINTLPQTLIYSCCCLLFLLSSCWATQAIFSTMQIASLSMNPDQDRFILYTLFHMHTTDGEWKHSYSKKPSLLSTKGPGLASTIEWYMFCSKLWITCIIIVLFWIKLYDVKWLGELSWLH